MEAGWLQPCIPRNLLLYRMEVETTANLQRMISMALTRMFLEAVPSTITSVFRGMALPGGRKCLDSLWYGGMEPLVLIPQTPIFLTAFTKPEIHKPTMFPFQAAG